METIQYRFVGRELAEGEICLGVAGDQGVRKLAFVLPDVAEGQLAYLKVDFPTPTKIPLQRADDGAWVCVLQAPALLESGIFGAQVEIFDGETEVWNSDIFHAVVRDSLSVNEDIEPVMLPELQMCIRDRCCCSRSSPISSIAPACAGAIPCCKAPRGRDRGNR